MTPYLTPETAEALRKALDDAASDDGDSPKDTLTQYLSGHRDGRQSCSKRLRAVLADLPIVGAVPAEEALERLESDARSYYDVVPARKGTPRNRISADCAAVRHALRAAEAQADAPPPPDVIRRGHEAAESLAYAAAQGSHRHLPADAEALLEQTKAALYPLKEK